MAVQFQNPTYKPYAGDLRGCHLPVHLYIKDESCGQYDPLYQAFPNGLT